MQSHIKEHLTSEIPLVITQSVADQLIRMVIQFEIQGEHPLTLNSQMFGVNKFTFTAKDRQMFFDIINVNEDDVVRVIKKIPSINKEFKVISDAFNLMSVYVVYCLLNASISVNSKHDAIISVLNYMQYRFFGSAVNHYFPHGATYEIMQTVVESLSLKFSVRQLGSWKKVMTERSESLAFDDRVHHNTLTKFDVDKNILYLISDTSTRIRSQLKIITSEYYSTRETNTFIMSHSSTTTLDGEKILREKGGSFEMVAGAVFNKVLIKASFVDERYIKMVQVSVPRLNVGIIRRMLASFSDEARHQMELKKTRTIETKNNTDIYIGIEELIDHMIHVIYSSAIQNSKVNINSKIHVYRNVQNITAAARSSNQELLNVKASIDQFLKRTHISSRESTISGLIIALMLYVTLLSFASL